MKFQEVAPGTRLLPFVNSYWCLSSDVALDLCDRTLPDGCQEIVFNINCQVKRSDNGKEFFTNPPVELIGQMTRAYEIKTQGRQIYFGIKFYPHSFAAFTTESIEDLRDQSIDLRLLFCRAFTEIYEAILAKPDFEFFVSSMENYLNQRLSIQRATSLAYNMVDYAVKKMFVNNQEVSLQSMHVELGVSKRHLLNIFKHHTGLSPKQFLRMVRFQSTLKGLQLSQPLSQIALESGYYDQAHLHHDFKALAGVTPTAWQKTTAPLNQFFVDESSRAYLCNYRKD